MTRMAEILKDLQQEIHLIKKGRTQEIRDNTPPPPRWLTKIEPNQNGGSTVGGGANPQYLTLADVNALLE